jgi:hypothetical protein
MVNATDKTHEQLELWCSAVGIEFINKEAEENYKRRTKRIADADPTPQFSPCIIRFFR